MLQIALRRIAAFTIDYCVVLFYMAMVFIVSMSLGNGDISAPETLRDKFNNHVISLLTLTIPVWTYFAYMESSKWQASIGKKTVGLKVETLRAETVPLANAFIRSGIKFLPWEMARIAIVYVPGKAFLDPIPQANIYLSIFAISCSFIFFVMMFIGKGRPPYDILAGSRVVNSRPMDD